MKNRSHQFVGSAAARKGIARLHFSILISLFCLLMLTVLEVMAEESRLQQILQKKEIRVGTSGDYQCHSLSLSLLSLSS